MRFFNGLYLLKVFCFTLIFISVKSYGQLSADFTASIQEGCSPLVVQFNDASSGNPTQWLWDLGNGNKSTKKDPGATYFTPGKYTITLTVKNASGENTVVKKDLIVVHADPTVAFSANSSDGCAPLDVFFKDGSIANNGTLNSWVWDFGDGTTSTLQNPDHTYNISDTFSVTLNVTNSFGCKKTLQNKDLIKVGGLIKAGFKYKYSSICSTPASVSFINTTVATGAIKYQWFFGDGASSTNVNPTHIYNTAGSFSVTLVAQNKEGCTNTYKQVINIGTVKTNFTYTGGCLNEPVIFADASSTTPVNETWDFGDGKTDTGITVSHTYNGAGPFTVTLTADFGGCISVIKKQITPGVKPKAAFYGTNNRKTCVYPVTVKFTNTSEGAENYKWLFGDGTSSDSINAQHTYTNPGTYSVALVAFNKTGCADTLMRTDFIQIGPPKILGIQDIPYEGCAPKSITFHPIIATPDSITSFKWTFGDGSSSTDSVPQHIYTNVGTYTVTLSIITAKGCTDSIAIINAVSLGTKPNANFIAKPLQSCAGDPIQFTDKSTGIITDWQWIFGDGSGSGEQNPLHQYLDTGYRSVTLIVSEYGCSDTLVRDKYVYLKPPVAKFSYNNFCAQPYSFAFKDSSINAKTWLWNFGDSTTDNTPSPKHIFTDTGKFPISLTVTNGKCSYTKYDTIQVVDENPSFTYKPLHSNFCKYDSLQFTVTQYQPENVKKYYWDFNDGNTQGFGGKLDTVYHSYTAAGNYLPRLTITDIHNCNRTVQQQVPLKIYGPAAAFSNTAGSCLSKIINFTDQSTSDGTYAITNWIWDYGDDSKTDTLTASPFSHSYSKTGTYDVTLKVTDANGCYDTIDNISAIEITQPVAGFFADSLTCANSALQFSDSSFGEEISYNWNFGDGNTSTAAAPQHAYSNEGLYNIKLTVTDKNGCTDSLTKLNYIKVSNPVSDFSLTDTSFNCPPVNVSPKNLSQNFTTLTWDFGDGNTSSEINPEHYYTTAGNYDVKLTVHGYGTSCFAEQTKKFILKGPTAELSYDSTSGCNPLNISFVAKTKNAVQFTWDFGNGIIQSGTDSVINYTYTSTGRFLPKLIAVDSGGCQVPIVNPDTIIVYGANAKFITQQGLNFCDSVDINFIDSSTAFFDNISSYKWNFDDVDSSISQNSFHTYHTANIYHPTLTITTQRGCVSAYIDSLNIGIINSPQISASVPDSSCVFSPVSLTAALNNTQSSNVSWLWNFGDGNTMQNQNANYTYSTSGKFPVSIIATNAEGCADTVKESIRINPLPPVDAGFDSVICLGQTTVLNATGAASYNWLTDASLSCTDCSNPIANPSANKIYFVTGKNLAGCTATDSVFVEVKRPSKVSITAPDSLCIGNTIQLTASGEEVYQWQPANLVSPTSGSQISSTPASTTVYSVIGTDTKRCFSDTAYKKVSVFPYPTIQIADSNVTIENGMNYDMNVTGSEDVVSWEWLPVNGLSCISCPNPVATPKSTITYTVKATNIAGCTVEKNITVTVVCKNDILFIPNTFSPNGDGMNDYFYPRGKGFTVKSLRIFSRWGDVVFEQSNFVPNNQASGWNGTYKGKALQPDVFVFVMQVICDNGQVFTSKGNVTLLR
jgi:gliding motility-associated-like protein